MQTKKYVIRTKLVISGEESFLTGMNIKFNQANGTLRALVETLCSGGSPIEFKEREDATVMVDILERLNDSYYFEVTWINVESE